MVEPRTLSAVRGSKTKEEVATFMNDPTTAVRSKDNGLTIRVLEYFQARPGLVVKVETLEQECGFGGEPAKRGSIQRLLGDFAARNPKDLEVVSSGRAWTWRGAATASQAAGTLTIIRELGDGSLLCEGPGGELYRAKKVHW